MAQNTNGEDEMFGEVGPRKQSLSFSAAKDDRFLDESQHQPKLSLSMFAADDIDEKPFKQDTKSFQDALSIKDFGGSSTRAGPRLMTEEFNALNNSCEGKHETQLEGELPQPAFEFNPMHQ